jgi:hypothetical protein
MQMAMSVLGVEGAELARARDAGPATMMQAIAAIKWRLTAFSAQNELLMLLSTSHISIECVSYLLAVNLLPHAFGRLSASEIRSIASWETL